MPPSKGSGTSGHPGQGRGLAGASGSAPSGPPAPIPFRTQRLAKTNWFSGGPQNEKSELPQPQMWMPMRGVSPLRQPQVAPHQAPAAFATGPSFAAQSLRPPSDRPTYRPPSPHPGLPQSPQSPQNAGFVPRGLPPGSPVRSMPPSTCYPSSPGFRSDQELPAGGGASSFEEFAPPLPPGGDHHGASPQEIAASPQPYSPFHGHSRGMPMDTETTLPPQDYGALYEQGCQSLPATAANLVDVDFSHGPRSRLPQRNMLPAGPDEQGRAYYPESFDSSGDPTWLNPPFGRQTQVSG